MFSLKHAFSALVFFTAAGLLLLFSGPALAVADLNVKVTDQGAPLEGTTLNLTFPDGTTGLSRGGELVYRGANVAGFASSVVTEATGAIKLAPDVPREVVCVIGCAVQTGVGAVLNTAGVEEGATVLVDLDEDGEEIIFTEGKPTPIQVDEKQDA